MVVLVSMMVRRARLWIERRVDGRHSCAKTRHHLLQHMIAPDADAVAGDLHIGVAVAEVPSEPNEFKRRPRRDFGERLGLSGDQNDATVIEHDAVAVAQCHRLVEVEQEFGAALAAEPDAAAMPVAGIEHDDVGSIRWIPEARAADGPAALHGRRFSAHNDASSSREIIMADSTTLKGKYSAAGEGNVYARANVATCKITSGDTGGTFEIFDEQCKPGFESRLHMHTKSFQVCYVVDGSGEFQLGDQVFHAKKGACVNIPPGVPHKVGSKEGMRMLMVYSPPGLEGMMKAMKALSPEQLADGALTSRILAEHDTVVLGENAGSKGYSSVLG
jgi:mannose-6-phosphate isomerase-like protein (cupin superfamily)